ncbi:hypothetical protein V5O48_007151 [Marasmius crinis-equi]|uniref:BZIP domain-containing protein n=1 Tax=Marasmius crinis-equi TaxID=585013 RepID=A0ABR3FI23_9AGAR
MPRKRPASSTTISKKNTESTSLPLQDITETVLHGKPGDDDRPSHPRPKRRAKVPKGALGQKMKQVAPPSSLPPSSPVASSSNYLPIASSVYGEGDGAGVASQETQGGGHALWVDDGEEDNWKENIDFSSQCYDENGRFIVSPMEEVEEVPLANSDPFGFFAMEEKLKVERANQPPKPQKVPPPSMPVTQTLNPPRTPHKQRVGKRPLSTPGSGTSSLTRTEIMPSSPSPAKRSSEQFTVPAETDLDASEESALVEADPDDSPPRATGRRKKPRLNDSPVNPDRLAKSLTSLLPKRRRGKTYRAYEDDDDSDEDHSPRKRSARNRRKPRDAKEEEEEIDVDADERMAQQRQARQEYFKKLQDYQIAKENVYVV